MHRYRWIARGWSCLAVSLLAGCAIPSSRENLDATAKLVATQTASPLLWWRDAAAERQARANVEAMLVDGLTLDEAITVAFLASPELQLALEQLEISRAQFVAAATPPNPVAIVGEREPGGNLSAFYPGRNVTVGVLQNLIGLLNMPDRRAIARRDLERARYEAASRITQFGARVAQAWLEYSAALRIQELRRDSLAATQGLLDRMQAAQTTNADNADILSRLRVSAGGVSVSLLRNDIDVGTAREKLGLLLGLAGWHDQWRISGSLPALPSTDFDAAALESAALDKRLDVQAAARAVDARLRVLAMQRHFRWLNQFDLGLFRDRAIGGTAFTGPNAVIEVPLFDQRQAQLLNADAELRSAMRTLESTRLNARAEIRTHAVEMRAMRALLEQGAKPVPASSDGASDLDRLRARLSEQPAEEDRVGLLRDYWRARSALALSLGDWPAAQLPK
jgi:cobalt-zinc-cadmium efflux system outer membrane protein